jgi:hypothetical protein
MSTLGEAPRFHPALVTSIPLCVFRVEKRSERAHEYEASASDRRRDEMSVSNQFVELRRPQARRFARLRDGAGEALIERDCISRLLLRRRLQPISVTLSPTSTVVRIGIQVTLVFDHCRLSTHSSGESDLGLRRCAVNVNIRIISVC